MVNYSEYWLRNEVKAIWIFSVHAKNKWPTQRKIGFSSDGLEITNTAEVPEGAVNRYTIVSLLLINQGFWTHPKLITIALLMKSFISWDLAEKIMNTYLIKSFFSFSRGATRPRIVE